MEDLKRTTGLAVLAFAPWIRDDQGEELRRHGIFYADLEGNAWLTWPRTKTLIDIRGRRPERNPAPEPGRLIEPAGLKVIHTLLTQPAALNAPMRRTAEETGVGVATVAVVLKQLRLAGYAVPAGRRTMRLERRADLVEHFVRGYGLKLRPAFGPRAYRHEEADARKLVALLLRDPELERAGWAVTGGMGANALLGHLEPVTVALHVAGGLPLAGHRMLPDEKDGNLVIFDWFAPAVLGPDNTRNVPLATPLLIYAELLAEGGARELETARLIHERFLASEAGS
jgi:hypothetical protein